MNKNREPESRKGIPISMSLGPVLEAEDIQSIKSFNEKRIVYLSVLAFLSAIVISLVAKALVLLIDFMTNLFFYGQFSVAHSSPEGHQLGLIVILIPAIGGIIVGLMAFYGSKAIRGHGIPEAMEQILTNQSRIKPSLIYLKPLSSAISIGTGGPFGAEGPIIATGGALGSSLGQMLKITANERKILLTAGATAGMAAIFGTPLAAVLLAIELLLFEFSPRSIIPVAIACITGAVGHLIFFEQEPVFAMSEIHAPEALALFLYTVVGAFMGLSAAFITRIVYFIEDSFEKLPVHWMWWPAIGGLGVGIIGYFAPSTMGVGYNNILQILSGSLSLQMLLVLCFLKFLSWSIALGSGTSGGTLAPLLTIGGAAGALIGTGILYLFPGSGISIPVCALVGMSAMFAGASQALLTSVVFALETTMQPYAILPLLGGCIAAYLISTFLVKNSIMTEKIARRGVVTPISYTPDILEKITVKQVISEEATVLSAEDTVGEIREWLKSYSSEQTTQHFVIVDDNDYFLGVVNTLKIYNHNYDADLRLQNLIDQKPMTIYDDNTLNIAVDIMAKENMDLLPVVSREDKKMIVGVLAHKDILNAYRFQADEQSNLNRTISLRRRGMKTILRGKHLLKRRDTPNRDDN